MTVIAAALIAITLALAGVVVTVCGAAVARSRVQASADLAALAAVSASLTDARSSCGLAGEVSERNATELTACSREPDGTFRVEVAVALPPWGTATARAHAGLSYG